MPHPEEKRCSHCGEPTGVGELPPGCPFGGNPGCTLTDQPPAASGDPHGDTAPFRRARLPAVPADGFPTRDDLADRRFGQYAMGPVIGRGSMGRVYRAQHDGLQRFCAIKVMNPALVATEPETVDQFWAEARAVAGLIHPHIVTVHNLGTERNYHFIEMELVEHREPHWREVRGNDGSYAREFVPGGVSLTEHVVREGPLSPERATQLVHQVALALAAAHGAGLVHRDIKPANVLLSADGQAKLADFGLVRRLSDTRKHATAAGTPTYMAPELFLGNPACPVTDLYAVGVMYFYLLSARLPYASSRISNLIQRKLHAPVPDVRTYQPETPAELTAILDRLLARDPHGRYDSAAALTHDLRVALGQLRDTASLVQDAIQGINCHVQQGDRERFRVIMPLPGERLQEVYVETQPGPENQRILSVYSLCGPARADHYEFALRLNADLTHGSLSIRHVNGQPMFVMSRSFSRSHVRPDEVRGAIQEIATHADQVEHQLTATDLY